MFIPTKEIKITDSYDVTDDSGKHLVRLTKTPKYPVVDVQMIQDSDILQISTSPSHYEKLLHIDVISSDGTKESANVVLKLQPNNNGETMVSFDLKNNEDEKKAANLVIDFLINPFSHRKLPYTENTVLQEYLIEDKTICELTKDSKDGSSRPKSLSSLFGPEKNHQI